MREYSRAAKRVRLIYTDLEREIRVLKKALSFDCIEGCGQCCEYPDIEAAPIEFYPLALHLLEEERLEYFLDRLENSGISKVCVFRSSSVRQGGYCSVYPHRGLVCRLFGFCSLGDKKGSPRMLSCRPIKEKYPGIAGDFELAAGRNKKIPAMSVYYSRIAQVSPQIQFIKFPINEAIKNALSRLFFIRKYTCVSS